MTALAAGTSACVPYPLLPTSRARAAATLHHASAMTDGTADPVVRPRRPAPPQGCANRVPSTPTSFRAGLRRDPPAPRPRLPLLCGVPRPVCMPPIRPPLVVGDPIPWPRHVFLSALFSIVLSTSFATGCLLNAGNHEPNSQQVQCDIVEVQTSHSRCAMIRWYLSPVQILEKQLEAFARLHTWMGNCRPRVERSWYNTETLRFVSDRARPSNLGQEDVRRNEPKPSPRVYPLLGARPRRSHGPRALPQKRREGPRRGSSSRTGCGLGPRPTNRISLFFSHCKGGCEQGSNSRWSYIHMCGNP